MKKLFLSLVFVGLMMAGCSDMGTNSETPIEPSNQQSLAGKEFIKLPEILNEADVENYFLSFKLIWGENGGVIPLNKNYQSPNGLVKVKAKLVIPDNAFSGLRLIAYLINDEVASTDFFPAMTFNVPLSYTLKIENIDLSSISNPEAVQFAYIAENGSLEIAEYDNLVVDVVNNTLEVVNAKIPHFSRFGFVK